MHGALLERMLDGMSWVYAAMHLQIPVCHLVQLSSEGPGQSEASSECYKVPLQTAMATASILDVWDPWCYMA